MPVVSRFLGIAIAILYRDRDPPYFHAIYGEYEITVGIRDGVVTGRFPRRALVHVLEWLDLHRDELMANWDRARDVHTIAWSNGADFAPEFLHRLVLQHAAA